MRRLLLAAALTLAALPAMARENHALLIGVSDYPNLDPRFWLKGPANDVRLVRDYLTTASPVPFAPERVRVLADGVEGGTEPTLAAIRAAFADLAEQVGPGDFVYLHFSGHGSQAPALDPETETDGLDEMFLPRDVGPWSDSVGTVENGLVDDEIGALLAALTARGADVWAVFDACHSGTATRAAPADDDEVRSRQLPPGALGVPEAALAAAEDGAATRALPDPRARPVPAVTAQAGPGSGRLVAFFASQTTEQTPERRLPKGDPARVSQGVFTFTLFQAVAQYPGATYGQIAQEVLRRYALSGMQQPTPLFEGDLDAVVFSGAPSPRIAQWPATRGEAGFAVPAGMLHGLAPGSRLALLASPADPTDKALGFVEVASAETFSATAVPAAGADLPAELPRGLTLRKVSEALDFTLTVALPPPGEGPAAALAAAQAALAEEVGPRIVFVAPDTPEADLRLAVIPDSPRPDAIWVLAGTGLADDLARVPSVTTADKDAGELAAGLGDTLGRMAKALNVMRLGAAVGGTLDAEVELMTRRPDDATMRGLPAAGAARLVPDDQIHLVATNATQGPVDVNILYVSSQWGITVLRPERLVPGATLRRGLVQITDEAFGRDRVIVVMTPADPQSAVENLAFLAQDDVDLLRGGSPLAAAMREAGFGETTRAAVALDAGPEEASRAPMILQFEIDTVPAY